MSKVNILPSEIVSKIAAGEVIERPASVVKELLENAFDAGTRSIEISLTQAGKSSITIKDTGIGIDPDDIEKIFQRHSTSKIYKMADLYAIRSLGFRGEALYSIASVSDVILRSKTCTNDTGWEIHVRGGKRLNLRPISMTEGTHIEVQELFFNTPARKKFLKTDAAELQQILNIFIPYTLLHPSLKFMLTHNNKTILQLIPAETYISRAQMALNLNPEHILEIQKEFPEKNLSIHLLLGDINIQRPRKDMQFIYVNNRPVYNNLINYHINQAYKLILPAGPQPFFFVHLKIPPENIDTNVHPTKREVKIKNESVIYPILRTLCEKTLLTHGKAKQLERALFSYNIKTSTQESAETPPVKSSPVCESTTERYNKDLYIETSEKKEDIKHKLQFARFIGPFLNKYLFFESGCSLLIVDQHAAQERITYERLIQQITKGRVETQQLITPLIIQLSPQEILVWENFKEVLKSIGLETTLWDKENIALHTHPQLIKRPEIALHNILAESDITHYDTDNIARRACRNSVMAGDRLSAEEIKSIRDRLVECKDPFICPHGRPTVVEIKENIFEKQFLRK